MTSDLGDHDRWTAVDHYLVDRLITPDPAQHAIDGSAASGLPKHEVSPAQGKLLHLLARMQGARRILELGTLGGYSTIWLARALPPDGQMVTLEADSGYAEVARRHVDAAGVGDRVDLRVGPALDTLPHLDGPFDLIFIDADKKSYPDYFGWALELSRPGTLVVADNVIRNGSVADPENTDVNVVGARRLHELVGAESRVTATTIQTVGSKGYDGFMLMVVNE